ncbi:hypothetical protein D3C87_1105430 [compost metagenome]
MADHYPALAAESLGVVGDQRDLPQAQLTLVVQVNVDATIELAGQFEDEIQLCDRVVVDTARVQSTDVFHAQSHGFAHQLGGAGAADQTRLREHHQLQVDQVAVVFTQLLHGLDMPQAEFRVDVDVATHGQRATGDAVLQQGAGPLRNRCGDFTQDAPFVGDVVLEGRAGAVGAPGLAPEGFVQVHVAFHQGGGEQLVLAVDVGRGQGRVRSRAALAEAAVFDQQVFGG